MVSETNPMWIPAMGEIVEPTTPAILVPKWPADRFHRTDIPLSTFASFGEFEHVCELANLSQGMYQSLATHLLGEMIYTVQDLRRLEESVGRQLNNYVLGWILANQDKEDNAASPTIEDVYRMTAEQVALYCVEVSPKDIALLEKLLEQRRRFRALRAHIERIITRIRSFLDKNSRQFCRMHRTLRTWFLFHGSHPPETCVTPTIRVSSGCAFIY